MSQAPDRRRRGLLVVLSSPSGAGKSTLSRKLMQVDPSITISVSATTRPMRPGETEGIDYHFVDDNEFDRLIAEDEFAEWAYVFDHRYGSPKEPIKEALKDGRDILFDIVVDQNIIIFRPMADFLGRAAHSEVDHFLAVGFAIVKSLLKFGH